MVRSGSIFARYPVSPFYAGRHANDKRKRQSIIVPHPGAGKCRPGALSDAEVVRGLPVRRLSTWGRLLVMGGTLMDVRLIG